MAYTLNSAKDSQGNEDQFVALFKANQAKIEEYKRYYGGDLEGAFQKVTGVPWPAGRSVKVHGLGKVEMTKDRTVKSVLGKYVLPIAAGVLAPYAIPALAGGGGAAAGTAGAEVAASGAPMGAVAAPGVTGALAGGGTTATLGTTAALGTTASAPSIWGKLLGTAIPAVAPAVGQIIGTKMQVDANQQAADAQTQAAQEALEWQKQVYATRQRQLAPAIGVGNAATLKLGDLMGLQAPPGGYQPDLPTDIPPGGTPAGTAQPRGPQAPPPQAAPSPQATVRLRAPTGAISEVPADQVEHYLSLGATRV